ATEIDYAFFLDNSMHMSITPKRIANVLKALHSVESERGSPLTPADRRQVISLNLVPNQQKEDRLGRNVVYYIDGVKADHLSQTELDAWKQRSGRRASGCGLSDERKYYPDFLNRP